MRGSDDESDSSAVVVDKPASPASEDGSEASAVLDERDLARARYHKENYGRDWNDPVHYHMVVNTELLGADGAADLVIARARALGWDASDSSEAPDAGNAD